VSDDLFLELAPLAALDALDCEDARAFTAHAQDCADCVREREAFERVMGEIGLATAPQMPPARLKQRVMGAAGVFAAAPVVPLRGAVPPEPWPGSRWPLTLAATLALGLGLALFYMTAQNAGQKRHAALLQRQLDEQRAVQEMMADPAARTVAQAGLPAAPSAGGRVLWSTQNNNDLLLASGLGPAPAGKVYEVWVIAGAAPVPSGLFHVDAYGRAAVDLPWRAETESVKTFAVTVEPEGGTPAPTGAMVLAGSAS
jgi:anti-sigma-K factor RskA